MIGGFRLAPEVFVILGALIEERSGLSYGPDDRELLASKIGPRATELGFDSFLDYYYFLRYDDAGGAELDALIDGLVVNESYLFREHDQLRYLVDRTITKAVAEGQSPRIWSAACAQGEEPYTLAMMLEGRGIRERVSIVATDVSARAIERARRGQLSRRALRDVREPTLAARFVREGRDGPVVTEDLRRTIDFRRVNLLDGAAVAALGTFDLILCRNVLIYFSDATVRTIVDRLVAALAPGGTLWVGVSESLLRLGTSLVCEEREGVFFYRSAS